MLQVPERRQKNFVEEVWGTAVGTVGTVGRTVGDVGNAMGRTVGDVGNATGGFLTKVTKVVPNLIPNGGADRQYDRLRSEVTGEAEGVVPSVSPMVMWKRLGCYLVVLVIGMVLGGVAVREEWIDLTAYDPALSAMDGWLTSPIADTTGNLYCDDGLFVPGPIRNGANTILFLSLLLWAFLGVAIAADVFMAGIEKITSEETTIERDGVVYTINVWNATIANLTLMALGSSAPEILLSVIEIVGGSFYAGELGPSTIVGSAAFNMLVISAVCVTAIPDGGGRRIKELDVFYVTAAFSLAAYLWLIIILVVITPNIVDVWEGVATFAAFPVLVYVAYRADVEGNSDASESLSGDLHQLAYAPVGYLKDGKPLCRTDVSSKLALKSIASLGDEAQFKAVASLVLPAASKAVYRQAATRAFTGAKAELDAATETKKMLLGSSSSRQQSGVAIVQWAQASKTVRESEARCELELVRTGNLKAECQVAYYSQSGTAEEGVDFEAARGVVTFRRWQESAKIVVTIIDDDEPEDDETFTVHLAPCTQPSATCELGEAHVCVVTIQDDDGPGELLFQSTKVDTFESADRVALTVLRMRGCQGTVTCQWSTDDPAPDPGDTASLIQTGIQVASDATLAGLSYMGIDVPRGDLGYVPASGQLIFKPGVTRMAIEVDLIDTGAYHRDDGFTITMSAPKGGAKIIDHPRKRTEMSSVTAQVKVGADTVRKMKTDELIARLQEHLASQASTDEEAVKKPAMSISALDDDASWADQFAEAVEMPQDGSTLSMLVWLLALPWKVIGAAVPPPEIANGWACFGVALVFIGILTAFIGDLASHMGCCMGLEKSVTAITFVALGTSLPDTFASKAAASNEPYADASIINITGSNSVNVFLGLGLPWMIAAFYWTINGFVEEAAWRERYAAEPWYTSDTPVGFAVPAGNLAFSVTVFCCTSTICLGVLIVRRKVLGFELGGPLKLQWLTFALFVSLWFIYIYLSVLKINGSKASS